MKNEIGSLLQGTTATRRASVLGACLMASVLVAACGGGKDESAGAGEASKPKPTASASQKDGQQASVKLTDSKDSRMASAVADSKTTAPIDLLYDLPSKPELGQPFTVELQVKPRQQADSLDVEIGDSPGLTVEGERAARFLAVEAGQPYTLKVQVRGNANGLYYLTVLTKISTKVQSEGRAFSVPVVIGAPVAAQKPAPQKDATGQAVESMPAKEK